MASVVSQDAIAQLRDLIEEVIIENPQLGATYKTLHQGHPDVVIQRILKARDNNVSKAFKMLMDCLHWRVNNDIDNILAKPIEPKEMYDAIRESYLTGMTGFCKQGRPVFALGVGLSGFEKAPDVFGDVSLKAFLSVPEQDDLHDFWWHRDKLIF